MYVPKVFAVEDLARLHDFIAAFNFGTIVTERDGKLTASHVPFVLTAAWSHTERCARTSQADRDGVVEALWGSEIAKLMDQRRSSKLS